MRRESSDSATWPASEFYGTVAVMAAVYEDVPVSELLHHPAATAERLDAVRALRLRRRDAGDLALMRIEQLERDESVVEFTTRLLAGLVRSENVGVIRRLLPDAVPWVTFLPEADFDAFVTELVAVARGRQRWGTWLQWQCCSLSGGTQHRCMPTRCCW